MPKRNRDKKLLADFADRWNWCEAFPWLDCCNGSRDGLHIHHVLGGAHRIDATWNLVRLCPSAHEWVHHRPQAGRVFCWAILDSRGAFEPNVIREAWGQCPLARIERALPEIQEDWIRAMGEALLEKFA
jgi:hypothetical protein